MQSTIDITVVIPLHNKSSHIIQTLNSVFNQLSLPDEVIVVDDGSTDDGPALVKQGFGEQVVMIQQKNAGVSEARNVGIRTASHPYVCLLDADDEWLPEYLFEIRELIVDFPQAVFYSARRFFRDENGKSLPAALGVDKDFRGLIADFPLMFSKGYGLISSSSVCLKKEIFDAGLCFPEGETHGEDLYYWLQFGMSGQLAFTAKPLVQVNLNTENRSNTLKGVMPYHIRWFLENRHVIQAHPLAKSVRKFIIQNAVVATYGSMESGDKTLAKRILKEFFKHRYIHFLVLLPAFVLPTRVLGLLKKFRRRLRK
jgi:glycosyltransferase involved in cell wall biosynthesis